MGGRGRFSRAAKASPQKTQARRPSARLRGRSPLDIAPKPGRLRPPNRRITERHVEVFVGRRARRRRLCRSPFRLWPGRRQGPQNEEDQKPKPLPPLQKNFPLDQTWSLRELNGKPVPSGLDASLKIDGALRGSGFTGCNSWSATLYPVKDQHLMVGPFALTKKQCAKDVMQTRGRVPVDPDRQPDLGPGQRRPGDQGPARVGAARAVALTRRHRRRAEADASRAGPQRPRPGRPCAAAIPQRSPPPPPSPALRRGRRRRRCGACGRR